MHLDKNINLIHTLSLVLDRRHLREIFTGWQHLLFKLVNYVVLVPLHIIRHTPHNDLSVDTCSWIVIFKKVVRCFYKILPEKELQAGTRKPFFHLCVRCQDDVECLCIIVNCLQMLFAIEELSCYGGREDRSQQVEIHFFY